MKVGSERLGSTLLLELEGRLTVEADTQPLDTAVLQVLQLDVSYLVLDLAKVDQLDCSGIGLLVRLNNQVLESGRDLVLINVERRVKHLLQRAGLLAVFPVFNSLQDATTCREHAGLPPCVRAAHPREEVPGTTRHAVAGVLQLAH